jgi:hypothetical protein
MTAPARSAERAPGTPPAPARHRPSIARSRVVAVPGGAGPDDAPTGGERRPLDRALPGRLVDLIREGVSRADLSGPGGGDRAVYRALVSTASSAHQRGWDRWEWEELVLGPGQALGAQVRLRRGEKPRPPADVAKTMSAAWERAETRVAEMPPPMTRADAEATASHLLNVVSDPATPLTDGERAVLAFAAREGLRIGTDRPTLPRQALCDALREATGLGLTALRTVLKHLDANGLLSLAVAGRPGGALTKDRRANVYRLPSPAALAAALPRPIPVPGNPVCGAPPTRSVVPLPDPATVPLARSVVPPSADDANTTTPPKEGTSMLTLTVTGTPEALAAALDSALEALGRHGVSAEAAVPTTPEADDLPENVVPLRAASGGGTAGATK